MLVRTGIGILGIQNMIKWNIARRRQDVRTPPRKVVIIDAILKKKMWNLSGTFVRF